MCNAEDNERPDRTGGLTFNQDDAPSALQLFSGLVFSVRSETGVPQ